MVVTLHCECGFLGIRATLATWRLEASWMHQEGLTRVQMSRRMIGECVWRTVACHGEAVTKLVWCTASLGHG